MYIYNIKILRRRNGAEEERIFIFMNFDDLASFMSAVDWRFSGDVIDLITSSTTF